MDLKTLLWNYTRQWLLKTQKYKIHKDNYVNRMTNDTITERCVLPKDTQTKTHTHTHYTTINNE